jgi:hypothetical protein
MQQYLSFTIQNPDVTVHDISTSITKTDYNLYRIRNPLTLPTLPTATNSFASSDTLTSTTSPPTTDLQRPSLAASFQNMEFTPSEFPIFNDPAKWHEWNEVVTSLGRAMDFGDIFDLKFKTRTDESSDAFAAFDWRNRQFYPVFNVKVQTNEGRDIVAKHRKDRDAHAIYRDLVEQYTQSTAAALDAALAADSLITYVNTASCTNVKFVTKLAFILHFVGTFRQIDDLTAHTESPLPKSQRKRLLMKAVKDIPELQHIETTEQILVQAGVKESDFDSYVQLLKAAAIRYDAQQAQDGIRSSLCRRTNNLYLTSSTTNDDDSDYDDDDDAPVFDATASVYEIHAAIQRHRQRPPRSRRPGNMPADIWRQLQPADRQHWDQLSSTAKELILSAYGTPPKPTPSPPDQTPYIDVRFTNVTDAASFLSHLSSSTGSS